MRCKKHLSDYSSAIGVCATCLRQRLFLLVQAQSNPTSVPDNPNPNPNPHLNRNHSLSFNQNHHKQKQQQQQQQQQEREQPPPLIFPRSVSPYIARRKSDLTTTTSTTTNDNNKKRIIQRFYSTPLVGPTTTQKKKNSGKFGLLSKLFRSKSTVAEVGVGSTRRRNHCGMSPQSEWDEEEVDSSPVGPTELTRPSPGRARPSHVASLALCLSPLVRASPASRYNWGIEPTISGEIRVPASGISHVNSINNNKEKPQLGEAASFCANRSRKIADFGRFNRNR